MGSPTSFPQGVRLMAMLAGAVCPWAKSEGGDCCRRRDLGDSKLPLAGAVDKCPVYLLITVG